MSLPLVPSARRDWSGLAAAIRPFAAALDDGQRRKLRAILLDDVVSEYDARFLSEHLYSRDIDFTPEFRRVESAWAVDELRHYRVFHEVLQEGWGERCEWLSERTPDFAPLEHLFKDEFSILVLGAYDELATVRAYRANLDTYAWLGPQFTEWVRAVIADEAWHYARFRDVLVERHADRLEEAPRAIRRVRESEGVPYAATFVLDHDDAVFTDEIFDDAARALERQLLREAQANARREAGGAGLWGGRQGKNHRLESETRAVS